MLMNYPSKHLLLRRKGKLLEHSNSLKGFRNILTAAVVSQRRCLPVESLQFLMRMEMLLLVICTMRGARRFGVQASWRRRWARCSRLGIAGMCLTRRRDCTIFVIGITILKQACFLQQTILAFLQKLTIAFTKRIYTHIVIITPFLVMIRGRYLGVACWCNCRCCIRCNWSNCQRCCYERFKSRG